MAMCWVKPNRAEGVGRRANDKAWKNTRPSVLQVSLAKGEKCVYTHPHWNDHLSDHTLPHCADIGYCLPLCWNDARQTTSYRIILVPGILSTALLRPVPPRLAWFCGKALLLARVAWRYAMVPLLWWRAPGKRWIGDRSAVRRWLSSRREDYRCRRSMQLVKRPRV